MLEEQGWKPSLTGGQHDVQIEQGQLACHMRALNQRLHFGDSNLLLPYQTIDDRTRAAWEQLGHLPSAATALERPHQVKHESITRWY